MDFKKKLKTRVYMAVAYIVIGSMFTVLCFSEVISNQYLSSLGIALIIMGIARIVQHKRITKDEESIRRQRIAETDERNIAILHKAKSAAFGLYVFIVASVIIVLEIIGNREISTILGLNVGALVLFYWIYRKRS